MVMPLPETVDYSQRKSGLLLHITSLPGREGIGTLGYEAETFIDNLTAADQKSWQMLPIHPTGYGDSPFQGPSVFAGNPALISLERLVETGDLTQEQFDEYLRKWEAHKFEHGCSDEYVDYSYLWENKLGFDSSSPKHENAALRLAYNGFKERSSPERNEAFKAFCEDKDNKEWLDDYALFMALKEQYGFGKSWNEWEVRHRSRKQGYEAEIRTDPGFYKYLQFVFDEHMGTVRNKARSKNIELIGDMPIYPAYDSADVWANQKLFQLNDTGGLMWKAGVPPDGFSKEGQAWGNPLYKWSNNGTYGWWAKRLKRELQYFDRIKIDHFRGFVAYGRIPPKDETGINTKWVNGPGKRLFDYLTKSLEKDLSQMIIAEDLGVITKPVRKLLDSLELPGMRVLQFANWSNKDPLNNKKDIYLPHNAGQDSNSVSYIGTHDNETLVQWMGQLRDSIDPRTKEPKTLKQLEQDKIALEHFERYLTHYSSEESINWQAIDVVSQSESNLAIVTIQDLFSLGKEARMNFPGNNGRQWWNWRMTEKQSTEWGSSVGQHLKEITLRNKRAA